MTPAIAVEHVSKRFRIPLDRSTTLKYRFTHLRSSSRYRHLNALRDVSFAVQPGEFLGVCGHNGSGKSTLLKILSRIYVPDSGRMEINGRVSPFLELGVGFNPELTARENVFLNSAILGLTRSEVRHRLDEIIDFAELDEFVDQKLKNFSSGMQVRLAFSVAIQANAEILLMDEVLAVGDVRFQRKCFEIFARHREQGRTVILVTHDLHAITTQCDRAVLLDHGELVADGAPGPVTDTYRERMADADVAAESGTGELRISDVRVCGPDGRAGETVQSDAPVIIEIEYEVRDVVEHVTCSILVMRADGVPVGGRSSESDGFELASPAPGSTGAVRFEVESLPLPGGDYEVHVALYERTTHHHIDRRERAATFAVVDEQGRRNLFDMRGRWSSRAAGAAVALERAPDSPLGPSR